MSYEDIEEVLRPTERYPTLEEAYHHLWQTYQDAVGHQGDSGTFADVYSVWECPGRYTLEAAREIAQEAFNDCHGSTPATTKLSVVARALPIGQPPRHLEVTIRGSASGHWSDSAVCEIAVTKLRGYLPKDAVILHAAAVRGHVTAAPVEVTQDSSSSKIQYVVVPPNTAISPETTRWPTLVAATHAMATALEAGAPALEVVGVLTADSGAALVTGRSHPRPLEAVVTVTYTTPGTEEEPNGWLVYASPHV